MTTTSPVWVEIDAGAIAHNLDVVRREVGMTTRLCGVVKADAYGHGIPVVLPIMMAAGIDTIGITSNQEAEEARRLGFSGRIIRLRAALRDEIHEGGRLDIEEWVGGGGVPRGGGGPPPPPPGAQPRPPNPQKHRPGGGG
ncbi:alanine racemase, partial [Microbacterium sp. NPDC055455]